MRLNKKKSSIHRLSMYSKRIRNLREDNDMSQLQTAKIIHVGQRTYSDYELGKTRIPVDSLIKLAEYYDVDMNYICGLDTEKHPFPRSKNHKMHTPS